MNIMLDLLVFRFLPFRNYRPKSTVFYLTAAIVLIFLPAFAFGQESENTIENGMKLTELTFTAGYGEGQTTEGIYEHILLSINVGFDLAPFFPQLERYRGITSIFLEPKINPVQKPDTGGEFGVSLGIKYRYPLNETWHCYFMGSVGPHYITVETNDQADGFIFFNTVGAGISFFLTDRSAVNLEYRFRHASNASTHEPNNGIDSHIGTVGYSLFF